MSNPMAEDELKSLDIKMWVEQLFATSATDEQLKLRLVKNISAYTTNKIIEELEKLPRKNVGIGKFVTPYTVIRDLIAELRKTL